MKKTLLILSLTALGCSLTAACKDNNFSSGDGDGDGDTTNDTNTGDGDTADTATGDGDTDSGDGDTDSGDGDGDGDTDSGDGDTDSGDGDGDGGSNGEGGSNNLGGAAGTSDTCSDTVTVDQNAGLGGAANFSCALPEAPLEPIAIAGSYTDNFYGSHTITNTLWDSGWSQFHLSLVNNEEGYALALNDEDNGYNACAWSRFVWFESEDTLYYCQAPYASDSECEAEEETFPDKSDLSTGCNGFSWSILTQN